MMDKNLLKIIIIVFILGVAVSSTKLFTGGISFFTVGITFFALAPYMIHSILSYWVKSKWISALTGALIVAFDIYVHLSVFVFPAGAQAAVALVFSPIAIGFLCVVSFVVLTVIKSIYHIIKYRKIDLENYKEDFTARRILLLFILPCAGVFLWFCLSQFLISANSIFEYPIHKAITYNDFKQFKKLIDEGADVNVPSRITGQKPLMEATGTGSPEMIKMLIEKGADPDELDKELKMTALMWAGFVDKSQAAEALIKGGADTEVKNDEGETALLKSIKLRYTPVTKVLLDAGANVNATDNDGETPLQKAARKGNMQAFKEILKHNPDLTIKNKNGFTALHWAAESGHREMVVILLEKGADPDAKTVSNMTADDYARNHYPEIVKDIEEARKKKAE